MVGDDLDALDEKPEFFRGFAEGALEVWLAVKAEL
jgi:hypothetical protein